MRQLKVTQTYTCRTGSVEQYFRDINRIPRVTPDEEVELAHRISQGDEEAFRTLVEANLRFVVSVSKQYQGHGLDLSDLINEGNMGLMKAARKFDPSRGFKFISYSIWWIRQSILQAISDQSRMVRLPMNQVTYITKVKCASTDFFKDNGREPTPEELAQLTDLPADKIIDALCSSSGHSSLDSPLSSDGDAGTLLDVKADEDAEMADHSSDVDSLKEDVNAVLDILGGREAEIIRQFYGIGCPEKTLDEIGEDLGISRERVRQLKDRAVRRLSCSQVRNLLRQYLG